MGKWSLLLGAFIVWTIHFFLLYAFASIFPGTNLARVLTWIATIPALAADAVLLWAAAGRRMVAGDDQLDRWALDIAAAGAGISFIAVLWQALPAVMV